MPALEERSLTDLFASHGLRCTRQRSAIYRALAATKLHPTADELFRQVSAETKGMSLATVYNTLEKFCEVGLAQKLPGSHGFVRYDANTESHLHVRCEKTGIVRDVPKDLSSTILENLDPNLFSEVKSRLGFDIKQVNIELVTDCNCGENDESANDADSAPA